MHGDRSVTTTRVIPVRDIRVRSRADGGDGRTVDAYCAVFNTPTEIYDEDGHYLEQNDPHAFDKSLTQRRDQIFCVYNHAKTRSGTPSDRFSVPLGEVVDIKPDGYGLMTSTRFNPDPE